MKPAPLFEVRDERKPGHHWADNEVLDRYAPILGAYGYAVYMYMGRHASNSTGRCTKSQGEIARAFGISIDTVQRCIAKLLEPGHALPPLIDKEPAQAGKPCVYVLLAVPKERFIPEGQKDLPLPAASISTDQPPIAAPGKKNLPPTAVTQPPIAAPGKKNLPPTAVTQPPMAAPPPLTAVPNKESKTLSRLDQTKSSAEEPADPRHAPLRDGIRQLHARYAHMPLALVPWDGREGKALRLLLAKHPRLDVANALACAENHYESVTNRAERIARWLPHLLEYWDGPLDEFQKPLYETGQDRRLKAGAAVGRY